MIRIEARLLANRVVTDADCWEWTRNRRNGYGRIWVEGRLLTVHRLAAHLWIDGFDYDGPNMACHRCDNPPCFNPEHLFSGSAFDNMSDASRKGRLPGTPGPRETLHPRQKPCAACGKEYEPDGDHRGRSVVCSWECRSTLLSTTRRGRGKKLTDEQVAEAAALIANGATYRSVATSLGVSASCVHRHVAQRAAA